MTPPPRTPHQRKQDTLHRLEQDIDAVLADRGAPVAGLVIGHRAFDRCRSQRTAALAALASMRVALNRRRYGSSSWCRPPSPRATFSVLVLRRKSSNVDSPPPTAEAIFHSPQALRIAVKPPCTPTAIAPKANNLVPKPAMV